MATCHDDWRKPVIPEDVHNSALLLVEINDKVPPYRPGALPHVTNLSLLPHTNEDIGFITTMLGSDPAVILSRGYGNCRITITATGSVWWVQYFNSQETLILITVEVGGVPDGDFGLMMQPDYPTAESLSEALEAVFGRIQREYMAQKEGIGRCQMCSLFPPVFDPENQAAAVATAEAMMEGLMDEGNRAGVSTREESTRKNWACEEVAAEADGVATEQDGPCALQERMQRPLSQRDMLRGVFSGGRAQAHVD